MPSLKDARSLDDLFQAHGSLVRIWEQSKNLSGVPPYLRDDRQLSARASLIDVVAPVLVPGMLQSPLYARYALAEGRPAEPMASLDRLVEERCSQLEALPDVRVTATFPETGIIGAPTHTRREQAAHLLKLMETDRIRVNLVPADSILAGVTSPFVLYTLNDGHQAATSEHTNGTILVRDTQGLQRLHDVARVALGNALPAAHAMRRLKEITEDG